MLLLLGDRKRKQQLKQIITTILRIDKDQLLKLLVLQQETIKIHHHQHYNKEEIKTKCTDHSCVPRYAQLFHGRGSSDLERGAAQAQEEDSSQSSSDSAGRGASL